VTDQLPGDGGRQQCLAPGDRPHSVGQFGRWRVLEQESAGSGLQRFVDVRVHVEGGDDQNLNRRFGLWAGQAPRRLDAVHKRHADVHHDHVGTHPLCGPHRHLPVFGLPDHFHVGLRGKDGDVARAYQSLVVADQHPDHG
jgi:hypothetical protein